MNLLRRPLVGVLLSLPVVLAACSSSAPTRHSTATTGAGGAASTSTTAAVTTSTAPSGPPGGPVPSGFAPASVTFTSASRGWVLGSATCSGAPCASVVRTTDGGHTWAGIPAPGTRIGSGQEGSPGVAELRFADRVDGWAFGSELWATHDGGANWKQLSLPGAPGLPASVQSLEAAAGTAYALDVPGSAQGTGGTAQLYQTPVGSDAWTPVAGTAVPNADSGRVIVSGSAVWVVVQTSAGQGVFLQGGAGGWSRRSLPCGQPSLAVAAADPLDLSVICTGGGAAGQQPKQVYLSADGGRTWRGASSAPMGGDTLDVAMASPTVVVVAAASGASWLYGSFDGARTWSTVDQDTTSGGAPWRDLGFTDPSQGVVVEGLVPPTAGLPPNRLLMSRDGGHTWVVTAFH